MPVNGQWNRVVYTRMVRSPHISPAKCCPGRGERVGGGHPAAAEADWPPPCRRASGGPAHGARRGRPQDAPRCGRRSGAEVAVGTLPSEVAGRSRVRLCPAARDVGPGMWDPGCGTGRRPRTFLKHAGAGSAPSRSAFSPGDKFCGRFAHTADSQTPARRPRIQLSPGRVCLDVA